MQFVGNQLCTYLYDSYILASVFVFLHLLKTWGIWSGRLVCFFFFPVCLFMGNTHSIFSFVVAGDATLGQDHIVISDMTSHMNTLILLPPIKFLYNSTMHLSLPTQITQDPTL